MIVRKILLVVNPTGGVRNGLEILKNVKPIFEAGGIELEIIETKYAGHAKDIARAMDIEKFESLCLVGGDGTMHEAINGMYTRKDNKRIPIGLIPAGTGNSLMHDFNCLDPTVAAKWIIKGYSKKIDLAEIKMEHKIVYAFNIIGWGMITDINLRADGVRWMGENRYTYSALMEIMSHKLRHAKLSFNDIIYDEKFIFILGSMTQFTGSAMKMAPKAKLDDGLIDILIVRDATRKQMLNLFPKIFTGDHINYDILEYHQVDGYSIVPDKHDPLNCDGETIGSTPIKVKVLRESLEVYTSKEIANS
ncbi:diacylglycerol kinase family lipid kinase [bacterium]|nr:diacylglycerol kinase family lipid kinase [bacterium]